MHSYSVAGYVLSIEVSVAVAVAAVVTYYILNVTPLAKILPFQSRKAKFLNKKRQKVKLIEKENVTWDVRRFRFALPKSTPVLGLPLGKAIKVFLPNIAVGSKEWNPRPESARGPAVPRDAGSGEGDIDKTTGEWKSEIVRKYTPCSLDCEENYFDLILKVYFEGKNERFPDGGKGSQYMNSLEVGDSLELQGPFGHIEYFGRQNWKKYGKRSKLGMIAGGTGITPMLQIIKAVLSDPQDTTKMFLLFANQTEEDILVRDMLEAWQRDYPNQLKVWYTLDRPPTNWEYSTGFISEEMCLNHLPEPSDETLILMCGPPPMIKFACRPNLEKIGHGAGAMATF